MLKELRLLFFILAHCQGISETGKGKIIQAVSDYQSIYPLPLFEVDWLIEEAQLTQTQAEIFRESFLSLDVDHLQTIYEISNINYCTIFDADYPLILKQIYQPPLVLFYQGNWQLTQSKPILAVVGARKASYYAKEVLSDFMPFLSKECHIVSGLARGVDTFAHEATKKSNGQTIAVIGSGLDIVYPKENWQLQKNIAQQDLLISEYPVGTPPLKFHFPMRNRIIAGISQGTLIIEAKRRSGSLITANLALQEGREVFAVPGNIFAQNSQGPNDLIAAGAKIVTTAAEILTEISHKKTE